MSTYLICFIVSDFVGITASATNLEGNTFPISVYCNRAQTEKATFALDIGVKIIEYYIKLFKINYPLPKLGTQLKIIARLANSHSSQENQVSQK